MTDFASIIQSSDYDFLRTNPHLGKRIILLTLGGSYSYGTNVETSDIDIRGCALNSPSDLLGMTNFDQVVEEHTDTTVYSFNRIIHLLLDCNPNVIEILGCKKEHYIFLTDLGQSLIDNRKLFFSRRALNTFGGYATMQLRRLENAIARDRVTPERKEEYILKALERAMLSFGDRYQSYKGGSIKLYTDHVEKPETSLELFADISFQHIPARELSGMTADLNNVITTYDKTSTHRNHKKDDAHLCKHAMHLIRLYLTGLDLFEKGDIFTYREADHDLLMSIRNGEYQLPDSTFRSEFFDMVNEYEKRFQYAAKNTILPSKPNFDIVQDYVMSVNRRIISDD